ncbi:MAG TPA: two-component regulator propeller domain-containing protein [Verrucomicrobiae bacterium]|nr:two-component regulator propeller domain-containing protein [Verrucomicrobiae bacterium]
MANYRVMLLRLKTLLAMLLLAAVSTAFAAERAQQYLTDVWTADSGLPSSSVTAVTQTPDGYLWIGTYNGLTRFDGVQFVTFDPATTPALAHARVRKLSVDIQGTLWINTYDGSMTSWRDGVFTREWTGGDGIDPDVMLVSSATNGVTFLLHRGSLRRKSFTVPPSTNWEDLYPTNRAVGALCVADGRGTIWYRNSDKILLRLDGAEFKPLPDAAGLADPHVDFMTTDTRGRLWVCTTNEIAVWDHDTFHTFTPTNREPLGEATFISITESNHIWAVVNGRVWEGFDRRWLREVESLRSVFAGNVGRLAAQSDHQGGVWLYDYERGLFHITADGQSRHFGSDDNFPGDRINSFFEDREGNQWAGLDAGGLVRIRERRFQPVISENETAAKPARSVSEDRDGTIWVGTLGNGLLCWPQGKAVTNLMMPGGTGKGFAFSVCPDPTGRLWVSAGAEDLYVREQGEFRRVLPVVHGVKAILVDHNGRIWAGTKSGLSYAEPDMPMEFKLFDQVPRTDIRALAEDSHQNLWVGSEDGGIFRITDDDATAFHPTDTKDPQAVWSLVAEEDGTVWAGTFRGGLLRLRNGQFTRFGKSDGLPDNVICQILDDGHGNLWLGSYHGITRVAKSVLEDYAAGKIPALTVTTYGRADGLPSLECSTSYQPAAWRGRDGRLWFTTLKGAVSVQPDDIRMNTLPPTVVIEEVLLDGKSVGPVREGETLVVPPGRHSYEFRYTANSLIASELIQFRYQLEGADADWIEPGTRRSSVQYGYLRPGDYRFHVTACNSDGTWNKTGAVLKLKVLPHFYETLLFQLVAGLAGLGILAAAIRHITLRRLRWKMQQLERQHAVERERTRIARDIHDDLGASLNLIAVLGDLAKKEKTDERIEKMSVTARQAVKSLDEIVWAVNPRNDTLAHLIDYAGQFATNYLRAAGIRCLLDVSEQLPACEVPTDVRHNLFLVIKEALQNIVKHSKATEVWLRVSITAKTLHVSIEDNGCGFESAAAGNDPWADGLRNMRERLEEMGGRCEIQSRLGAGTTIIVDLPWPPG